MLPSSCLPATIKFSSQYVQSECHDNHTLCSIFKHTSYKNLDNHTLCCFFKYTSDRNLGNHTLCCIFKHTSDRNLDNHALCCIFKHTSDRNLDNHTLCCIFKHTSDRNLGNHCVLISSFQQALGLGDNLPNSKNTSLKTTYIRPLIQILLFQIHQNKNYTPSNTTYTFPNKGKNTPK